MFQRLDGWRFYLDLGSIGGLRQILGQFFPEELPDLALHLRKLTRPTSRI